jgi:hypothetical protein
MFVVGLVDLGLSITLAIGLGMQAVYLPATVSGCSPEKAEAWQVINPYESFFVQAQTLGYASTASSACNRFVISWDLAVAVL